MSNKLGVSGGAQGKNIYNQPKHKNIRNKKNDLQNIFLEKFAKFLAQDTEGISETLKSDTKVAPIPAKEDFAVKAELGLQDEVLEIAKEQGPNQDVTVQAQKKSKEFLADISKERNSVEAKLKTDWTDKLFPDTESFAVAKAGESARLSAFSGPQRRGQSTVFTQSEQRETLVQEYLAYNGKFDSLLDVRSFLNPDDSAIQNEISQMIRSGYLGQNSTSIAEKALDVTNYLVDNFTYKEDAQGVGWKTAGQTIADGGGDCEDLVNLAGSMLLALGVDPANINIHVKTGTIEEQGHVWLGVTVDNGQERIIDISTNIGAGQMIAGLGDIPANTTQFDFSYNTSSIKANPSMAIDGRVVLEKEGIEGAKFTSTFEVPFLSTCDRPLIAGEDEIEWEQIYAKGSLKVERETVKSMNGHAETVEKTEKYRIKDGEKLIYIGPLNEDISYSKNFQTHLILNGDEDDVQILNKNTGQLSVATKAYADFHYAAFSNLSQNKEWVFDIDNDKVVYEGSIIGSSYDPNKFTVNAIYGTEDSSVVMHIPKSSNENFILDESANIDLIVGNKVISLNNVDNFINDVNNSNNPESILSTLSEGLSTLLGSFSAGDLPTLPQSVVDFAAGFGDALSFGLTSTIRDNYNISGVNKKSSSYGGASILGSLYRDYLLFRGVGVGLQAIGGKGVVMANAALESKALQYADDAAFEWQALPSGGFIKHVKDAQGNLLYHIKKINDGANVAVQALQKSALSAQAKAFENLTDMAPEYYYLESQGMIISKHVESFTGSFWETWWEGSKRLGTIFNDIRPRNVGGLNVVFDPAKSAIQQMLEGFMVIIGFESYKNSSAEAEEINASADTDETIVKTGGNSASAYNGNILKNMSEYIAPQDEKVNEILDSLAGGNIYEENNETKIKLISNYIIDNYSYEKDVAGVAWKDPAQIIIDKKGDCEDIVNLLASLLIASGIESDKVSALVRQNTIDSPGHLALGVTLDNDQAVKIDITRYVANKISLDSINNLPSIDYSNFDFSYDTQDVYSFDGRSGINFGRYEAPIFASAISSDTNQLSETTKNVVISSVEYYTSQLLSKFRQENFSGITSFACIDKNRNAIRD